MATLKDISLDIHCPTCCSRIPVRIAETSDCGVTQQHRRACHVCQTAIIIEVVTDIVAYADPSPSPLKG